jgi:superfamily II DNA or RNA helicase
MGKGLSWKLALTGTPAPNDRIEYANHAVFLDQFPTVNSFLARYFVNRGETGERWELKPHALQPFYRSLSHWSIFLTNPGTYGWKDNAGTIPPIITHVHSVPLTTQQQDLVFTSTGTLFAANAGGITSRSVLSQIAKGNHKGEAVDTAKPAYIRRLVESWPDESTIIWCKYNAEQDSMAATFPGAANIDGGTPYAERMKLIDEFKAGMRRVLISKPKILGFGLNLQIATRQVFSGLQDSYEEYYQAVKRSNRFGSTLPLNVHIPITEIERPMIETVLEKAARVQADAEEQERMFKNASL